MLMTMTWCFVFSFVVQIGQEMSQNSFIQQYLAKQQELLRQRLEREAQQNEEANANGCTNSLNLKNKDCSATLTFNITTE